MKVHVGQGTKHLGGNKKVGDTIRAEITHGGFADSIHNPPYSATHISSLICGRATFMHRLVLRLFRLRPVPSPRCARAKTISP